MDKIQIMFWRAVLCLDAGIAQPPESIRPQNVKMASPDVAALSKVADMPIAYHTGTPNEDIPIYKVQVGPL